MKKIFVVTSLVLVMMVSFIGVTYSYEYPYSQSIMWEFNGMDVLELNIGDNYIEYGVRAYRDGIDISDQIFTDASLVDTSKVGEYKVKYSIVDNDGIMEYIYRIVKVVDMGAPIIKLKGDSEIILKVSSEYIEPGYEVIDDKDDNLKVMISGVVDTSKVGEYELIYLVVDSDMKQYQISRKIIVK